MYEVHLFQYTSQFNTVFSINPGSQYSPITFTVVQFISGFSKVPKKFLYQNSMFFYVAVLSSLWVDLVKTTN
jgi:hypothetical protein